MNSTRTAIAQLPTGLRSLAAAWARKLPDTQAARQVAIKALPDRAGLSLTDARQACESAVQAAGAARRARRPAYRKGTGRKAVTLPAGTLSSRLDALRQRAVLDTYRVAYRIPDGDHGGESVVLTSDPAKVGAIQNTYNEWGAYSRACRYPKQHTDTTITVPADWRMRVQRAGLAIVDGMMTLDAGRLEGAPVGVDLFAATWIVQGRGYSVTVERGCIARYGATAYHGVTAEQALAGLRRKLRAVEWNATLTAWSLSDLLDRLSDADLDGATVRVSDARAIGACDYGIKSWCHATGLDYDAGQASLRQVWTAYQAQPRTEARATLLHALRRQRRLSLAA